MKRKLLASILAAILLLAACAPAADTPPPESSSSSPPAPAAKPTPEEPPAWNNFRDMQGEPVTLESGRVTALSTGYAQVWCPEEEGYRTLERYNMVGKYRVEYAETRYTVRYQPEGAMLVYDYGLYAFSAQEPMAGLLQVTPEGKTFFLYPSEDFRLFYPEPRTAETQAAKQKSSILPLADGGELLIQPIPLEIEPDSSLDRAISEALPPAEGDGPRWYNATFDFGSEGFHWFSFSTAPSYGSSEPTSTKGSFYDGTMTIGDPVFLAGPVTLDNTPAAAEPTHSPTFAWEELRGIAGESLRLEEWQLDSLFLDYILGWDPAGEGYFRLEEGQQLGNYTVSGVKSSYFVSYPRDRPIRLYCDYARCTLTCREPVPGLLQITPEENGAAFFPYPEEGFLFPLLHYRDRDSEEGAAWRIARLPEVGGERTTQPFRIWLDDEETAALAALLSPAEGDGPRWYDVSLRFDAFEVHGHGGGLGEAAYVTRIFDRGLDIEASTIGEEVFLTGPVEIYNMM